MDEDQRIETGLEDRRGSEEDREAERGEGRRERYIEKGKIMRGGESRRDRGRGGGREGGMERVGERG